MEREKKKKRVAEVTKVVELKELKPNEVPPMILKFEHSRDYIAPAETLEYFASVQAEGGPLQALKRRRTGAPDPPVRRSVKCHDVANPGTTYSPVEPSLGQAKGIPAATLGSNPIARRFLAVRNKRDNTVKLVEIQPFVLSPDLWRERGVGSTVYDDYPEGDEADKEGAEAVIDAKKEELSEKQKKLIRAEKTIMEFGTKKKQRNLVSSKRGARGALSAVDMEDVSSQMAMADTVVNPMSEAELEEYQSDMFPPCNKEATDVAQLYSWEDVVGRDMLEKLREILPEKLKSQDTQHLSAFNIEQAFKPYSDPPTQPSIVRMAHVFKVCAATCRTEEGLEKRNTMLCGALFFDLLLFMSRTRINALTNPEKWPSWVSKEVRTELMDFFLERGKKMNSKAMYVKNKAAETKVMAYMVVMDLLLGENKFGLTALSKITGQPPAFLKIIVQKIGAHIVGASGKEFVILKLPLVKQEAVTKRIIRRK